MYSYTYIHTCMCVCLCVRYVSLLSLASSVSPILADDLSISEVGPLPEFPAAVERVSVCIVSTACAF